MKSLPSTVYVMLANADSDDEFLMVESELNDLDGIDTGETQEVGIYRLDRTVMVKKEVHIVTDKEA